MTGEPPGGAIEQAVQSKRVQLRKEMRAGETGFRRFLVFFFKHVIVETMRSEKGEYGEEGYFLFSMTASPLAKYLEENKQTEEEVRV